MWMTALGFRYVTEARSFFGGVKVLNVLTYYQAYPAVIIDFAAGTPFNDPFSAEFIAILSLTSSS